jgi:hypothetical protein
MAQATQAASGDVPAEEPAAVPDDVPEVEPAAAPGDVLVSELAAAQMPGAEAGAGDVPGAEADAGEALEDEQATGAAGPDGEELSREAVSSETAAEGADRADLGPASSDERAAEGPVEAAAHAGGPEEPAVEQGPASAVSETRPEPEAAGGGVEEPVDEEAELDAWLDDGDDDLAQADDAKAEERGHVIPFPGGERQVASTAADEPNAADAPEATKEHAESAAANEQTVDDAAAHAAGREGKSDPSEASINVKDEAFFASDYQEEAFSDLSFDDEAAQPSKAKWVAVVMALVAVVGGGVGLYHFSTSPYVGEGPEELRVKATEVSSAAATTGAAADKAQKQEQSAETPAGASASTEAAGAAPSASAKASPVSAESEVVASAAEGAGETTEAAAESTAEGAGETTEAAAKKEGDAAEGDELAQPGQKSASAEPAAANQGSGEGAAEPAAGSASDAASYDELVKRGRAAAARRRSRKAAQLFSKALQAKPDGWEALEQLALVDMEAGRMAKALKLARKAVAANPKAPYAQLVIGAHLQNKGDKAGAKKAYEIFVKTCPDCRYANDIKAILQRL